MSKRREWWLTAERKIVCNSHESAANCNEGVIHVREVLPGERPLPFPTMGDYRELLNAATAALSLMDEKWVDLEDMRVISSSDEIVRSELRRVLYPRQSEVGDE